MSSMSAYMVYSRVSQKFCNILVNMRYNLAALDAFAEVVEINNTGLWETELAWCSPNVAQF